MDEFPSAFERFEEQVDVARFRDYDRLRRAFIGWAGFRWVDSVDQNRALRKEALDRGISFRGEAVRVRREFSREARAVRAERRAESAPILLEGGQTFERVRVQGKSQARVRDNKTGRFVKIRRRS